MNVSLVGNEKLRCFPGVSLAPVIVLSVIQHLTGVDAVL